MCIDLKRTIIVAGQKARHHKCHSQYKKIIVYKSSIIVYNITTNIKNNVCIKTKM